MKKQDFWTAFLLGVVAFFLVAVTLQGPGLTWDEANFIPSSISYLNWFGEWKSSEAFTSEAITTHWIGTHGHPPLAKLFSGLSIFLFHKTIGIIASARLFSASCFALTVILIYLLTRRFGNFRAGLFAGLSLLVMPRFFGHAHLAALDLPMSMMFVLVTFSFVRGLDSRKWSLLTGLFFGLALATKLNAFFLPFPLFLWAYFYRKGKHTTNFWAMLLIAPLVFLALWPWLWVNTLERLWGYFAFTIKRIPIPVYYLGKVYGEVPPPWHYPLKMTIFTLPAGLLVTILAGFYQTLKSSFRISPLSASTAISTPASSPGNQDIGMLIILSAFFPLFLMSLPGIPKYDGVRLFLPIFPFLAILSGLGLDKLAKKGAAIFQKKFSLKISCLPLILGLLFLGLNAQGILTSRPFYLSYYNGIVGGLKGAEKMGLENTYWGDSFTGEVLNFLNKQAPGTKIHAFPVGSNVISLLQLSGQLNPQLKIVPREEADFLILICRQGMFDKELWNIYKHANPVPETSVFYQGVLLTAVYQQQ